MKGIPSKTKWTETTPSRTSKVILSLFRTPQTQIENERKEGETKESAHPQAQGTEVELDCPDEEIDERVEGV